MDLKGSAPDRQVSALALLFVCVPIEFNALPHGHEDVTENARSEMMLIVGLLVGVIVASASVPAGATIPSGAHEQSITPNSSISTVPVEASRTDSATASRTIELQQELRLTPGVPGEITVTLRYSIPTDVVDLKARLPADATVTSTDGFVERAGADYAWDRQTSTPTLTYRLPVNETLNVTGPIAGKGDYTFVDSGDWALVRVPRTATGWSWTGGGTVGINRSTTTAGQGAVGTRMAFLGDHSEVTRTAHGQTFRLVVPARANLKESPARILDSMAAASSALRIGDRDERVFIVAAPTEATRWGLRGIQTGDSDMWVRDAERLDSAGNTWLHEYVHTRQGYVAGNDVRWVTEATASYYAALLTLEQGRIDFEAFRKRLALGGRTPDRSAILADPTTWNTIAPYTKGALVAGELDRQTRQTTNRTGALQDVLSRMNSRGDTVTAPAFRDLVRQSGGAATVATADRYTTTDDVPTVWNRTVHSAVFDATPARIGYALPAAENRSGYRVGGPYRNGSIDADGPLSLAVGETLTVNVTVSNTGGAAGEYDARLFVNGDLHDRQRGELEPGESETLTFTHGFARAGAYTLSVGGRSVAVNVRQPATPRVTAIQVRNGHHQQDGGRELTVDATVLNNHSFPAAANLTLYRNGNPVETRHVRLAPETERRISFDSVLATPGDHVFRVADRRTTVRIDSTRTATVQPEPTSTDAAGFGLFPALAALVGVGVGVARRR